MGNVYVFTENASQMGKYIRYQNQRGRSGVVVERAFAAQNIAGSIPVAATKFCAPLTTA